MSAVGGLALREALCGALLLPGPADPGPGPRSSLSCFHDCVNGERSAPPPFLLTKEVKCPQVQTDRLILNPLQHLFCVPSSQLMDGNTRVRVGSTARPHQEHLKPNHLDPGSGFTPLCLNTTNRAKQASTERYLTELGRQAKWTTKTQWDRTGPTGKPYQQNIWTEQTSWPTGWAPC